MQCAMCNVQFQCAISKNQLRFRPRSRSQRTWLQLRKRRPGCPEPQSGSGCRPDPSPGFPGFSFGNSTYLATGGDTWPSIGSPPLLLQLLLLLLRLLPLLHLLVGTGHHKAPAAGQRSDIFATTVPRQFCVSFTSLWISLLIQAQLLNYIQ